MACPKILSLCMLYCSALAADQAPLLIHISLSTQQEPVRQLNHQSIVIDNECGQCQMDDLAFEVQAKKELMDVAMRMKIFALTRGTKTLVASPDFSTKLEEPARIALEKDGQPLELTFVAVEIE